MNISDGNINAEFSKEISEKFNFDNELGINQLSLYFPAHAEGMYGECFMYSIYFDKCPDEQEVNSVSTALNQYDFKLIDDDYIGYTDVSISDGKIIIYLDLGNTVPQNEIKIIHGILLALNSVNGIKNVIVNEEIDVF